MSDIVYTTVESIGYAGDSATIEAGLLFSNTTNEDIVITRLARWVHVAASGVYPRNTQTHTLKVYALGSSPAVLLASVEVDCSSVDAGGWVWGALTPPLVLAKGTGCAIVSTEYAGGDRYASPYHPAHILSVEDIGNSQEVTYNGTLFSYYGGPPPHRSSGPLTFAYSAPVRTWTKSGTIYTTDGTYYQITSAINHASPGDTVNIPAGTYTWGEGGVRLTLKAGVTLAGAGQGSTVINMHPTATTSGFTATMISLGSGSVIRDMTFIGGVETPMPRASLFATGTSSGWRITNITFTQQSGQAGYFLYGQYTPNGLIDNCTITGGVGNSELIFTRGTMDSWDTPHSLGGPQNIFIEDCTFNGVGYVNDANSNGRHVVRGCTITGNIKVDGHGVWTNGGPVRGCRHMEVYNNLWTYDSAYWTAIEIRGGGGRVFNNSTSTTAARTAGAQFYLTEYGMWANNGAFLGYYQTPRFYPVRDQIGRGRYAVAGDWTTATSEPVYLWGNRKAAGADWALSYKQPNTAAIAQHRAETGDPLATFTAEDIIQADRDYFREVASFDGTTGVGIGTKAEMLAITPSKTGVGFWVTDEGSWDTTLPANTSGQLYIWNGSAWVLHYTPYTYPHPLRGSVSAPAIITSTSSQTVAEGSTVVQSVSASGNPAPTYQWRKDGSNISGATSSTLTLTSVDSGDAGSYDCVVTNSEGFATSTAAVLTIIPATDSTPPTPNPATIASATAVSATQIDVVATTAIDVVSPDVQYNHAIDGIWQGWQSSPLRYFTELEPDTTYAFLVQSRDGSLNATEQSAPANATTHSRGGANPLLWRGPASITLGVF